MANLKLRARIVFPANVSGENGVTIDKAGGAYTAHLDYGTLSTITTIPPVEQQDTFIALHNPVLNKFSRFPAANLIQNAGTPIFILASGQSNMVQSPSFPWTPASNLFVWNNAIGDANSVGNAFLPPSQTTVNVSTRFASEIARANPTRAVYLLICAAGSQHIGHWLDSVVTFDSGTDAVTWSNFYPRQTTGPGTADQVKFSNTGGALAAPLVAGTTYFIRDAISDHSFTLAATEGGSLINLTTNGTGTSRGSRVPDVYGNIIANIATALVAAGVTSIDCL